MFRYEIIEILKTQKALGALDSRDSLRASAAMRPVVLASSGFAESASPFQSARNRLLGRQIQARSNPYLNTPADTRPTFKCVTL